MNKLFIRTFGVNKNNKNGSYNLQPQVQNNLTQAVCHELMYNTKKENASSYNGNRGCFGYTTF